MRSAAKTVRENVPAGALASGVSVVVDGNPLNLSPGPIERGGRVYVPLRGIFEKK